MGKSKELREAVVAYRLQKHTLRETSELFGVSMSAVNSWVKKYQETGDLSEKPLNKELEKIGTENLKAYVKEHSDDIQQETAEASGCCNAAENNENNIVSHFFSHREEDFEYASFDREMAFYESICAGNIDMVWMYAEPLFCDGCGTLSKDPLRNIKYHFIITTAMIARFCIGSGMTTEEAYSLSDIYIMKADECTSIEEVRALHVEMIEEYTRKMYRLRSSTVYSKRIVRAMEYISEHLHSRIMVYDAAEYLEINSAYLSRLFKSETGMTFSEYVNRKKIEEAASLLRFSEYTDLEISNLMCFSSQSYFIKIFRKYKGMTPNEYKKKYRFPELRKK